MRSTFCSPRSGGGGCARSSSSALSSAASSSSGASIPSTAPRSSSTRVPLRRADCSLPLRRAAVRRVMRHGRRATARAARRGGGRAPCGGALRMGGDLSRCAQRSPMLDRAVRSVRCEDNCARSALALTPHARAGGRAGVVVRKCLVAACGCESRCAGGGSAPRRAARIGPIGQAERERRIGTGHTPENGDIAPRCPCPSPSPSPCPMSMSVTVV
mmetsp:Transcript_12553/g.33380  ORF Transcript_12553/g.33380 Transcript_12553/m.33380 type:complete len:215 (-) Transcript_12553:21-665(-)